MQMNYKEENFGRAITYQFFKETFHSNYSIEIMCHMKNANNFLNNAFLNAKLNAKIKSIFLFVFMLPIYILKVIFKKCHFQNVQIFFSEFLQNFTYILPQNFPLFSLRHPLIDIPSYLFSQEVIRKFLLLSTSENSFVMG